MIQPDSGAPTGSGITVCIIDSGVHQTHEDLSSVQYTGGYPTGWNTDSCGHGSHVAGTIACNYGTEASVNGAEIPHTLSGVAPRANIVAYDICYTNTATGQGLCPNVSTVASINQAVADGVDVINYSIGGGEQPWADPSSLAFLGAVDAGIYVAEVLGSAFSPALVDLFARRL